MLIPILAQTAYNYSYLVGATESLLIADRVPVFMAKTLNLSVRIHKISLPGGGSFQFLVYGVNPSSTDGTLFVTSSTIGNTLAFSTASPNLISLASMISEPAYPFVRVVMLVTGPSSANAVYAELSADLVLRPNVLPNGAGLSARPSRPVPASCTAYCEGGTALKCSKGNDCSALDGIGCFAWDSNGIAEIKTCSSPPRWTPPGGLGLGALPPPPSRAACEANCGGGQSAVCGGIGCEATDFKGCVGYLIGPDGQQYTYNVPCNSTS